MAMHGKAVRAGQPRRSGADHRDPLAGRGGAGKGLRLPHDAVGGIALQAADLDRPALGLLAHAGAFAKGFGRADPGAHAAQDIRRQDRLRRRLGGVGGDLADEQRDVDAGGAGGHARRVIAEITAIRSDGCLMGLECGIMVGKSGGDGLSGQSCGG